VVQINEREKIIIFSRRLKNQKPLSTALIFTESKRELDVRESDEN